MKTLFTLLALSVASFSASAQNIYDISGTKNLRTSGVLSLGQNTNTAVSVRPFINVGFIVATCSAGVTNVVIEGSNDNVTFATISSTVVSAATNLVLRFDFSANPIYIRSIVGTSGATNHAAVLAIGSNKSN